MKKFLGLILGLVLIISLVGCGSEEIVGDWYVVSTEVSGDSNAQTTANVYEKYRQYKITEDGRFISVDLDHTMSYKLLEDSYIEFHNMGSITKHKYKLSADSLQISLLDGDVIVNFIRN